VRAPRDCRLVPLRRIRGHKRDGRGKIADGVLSPLQKSA
jgi:hypothetical protein